MHFSICNLLTTSQSMTRSRHIHSCERRLSHKKRLEGKNWSFWINYVSELTNPQEAKAPSTKTAVEVYLQAGGRYRGGKSLRLGVLPRTWFAQCPLELCHSPSWVFLLQFKVIWFDFPSDRILASQITEFASSEVTTASRHHLSRTEQLTSIVLACLNESVQSTNI